VRHVLTFFVVVVVDFTSYALWPVKFLNQLLKLRILLDILVGLLGRGIGPSQGLYLYRIVQHRKPGYTSMP